MKHFHLEISTQSKGFDRTLLPVIKRAARVALEFAGKDISYTLSLLICDDEKMRELNNMYRGVNLSTDVLSFPAGVQLPDSIEHFLGDIAISHPTANRQAQKYQLPLEHELALLTVHGILHLLGYDHATIEDENNMWRVQKEILNRLDYDIELLPGERYAQE